MRELLYTAECKCTKEDVKEFCLDTLKEEIEMLKNAISHDSQEVRRCHNDLQYGNIAMDKDGTTTLLNYECSTHNPVAYDIANHFCEMVANYHSETPHMLDYSKYPGLKERQRFIEIYMSHGGYFPTDAQMERLLNDVEKYTLASHLLWCLRGIISNYLEVIEFDQEGYQRKMFIVEVTDFDYMEYARQRFQQYRLRKRELLGSSGISP
ncbi:Protein kinase-like domain containing protein [Parasponia andersonii]|uniref:Protein kinase-like domain containing protein n=1 Tax=Parasponia andersonii TaxID=3476 RepID=A0A2P5C6V0_PARAD|nr:Protein kinase-like domain containing protein [Parasponia andersonii]